jgi:hypothetical protein
MGTWTWLTMAWNLSFGLRKQCWISSTIFLPLERSTKKLKQNDSMSEWCVRQHGAVRTFSESEEYRQETSSLCSPA